MVDKAEIIALRKHLGLSQKEFGELIGTTQGSVSRFELGTVEPIGSTRILLERMIRDWRAEDATPGAGDDKRVA